MSFQDVRLFKIFRLLSNAPMAMDSENTLLHASLNTLLIVWCSLEACVDILISGSSRSCLSDGQLIFFCGAGTLLHSLSKTRTGTHRSDKVINRLMQTTIQSGERDCYGEICDLTGEFY
jgi:hypothetical protein